MADYNRQVSDKLAATLADHEIGFRGATMAIAELTVRHIGNQLKRLQGAETLLRLVTAAKKAQELGMAALNRPETRLDEVAGLSAADWVYMREIRRGAGMDPE